MAEVSHTTQVLVCSGLVSSVVVYKMLTFFVLSFGVSKDDSEILLGTCSSIPEGTKGLRPQQLSSHKNLEPII